MRRWQVLRTGRNSDSLPYKLDALGWGVQIDALSTNRDRISKRPMKWPAGK